MLLQLQLLSVKSIFLFFQSHRNQNKETRTRVMSSVQGPCQVLSLRTHHTNQHLMQSRTYSVHLVLQYDITSLCQSPCLLPLCCKSLHSYARLKVRAGISSCGLEKQQNRICWILEYFRAVPTKLEILVTPGSVNIQELTQKRVTCSKTSSILASSLEVSIPSMTKHSLIQEFNSRTLWHSLLLVC